MCVSLCDYIPAKRKDTSLNEIENEILITCAVLKKKKVLSFGETGSELLKGMSLVIQGFREKVLFVLWKYHHELDMSERFKESKDEEIEGSIYSNSSHDSL